MTTLEERLTVGTCSCRILPSWPENLSLAFARIYNAQASTKAKETKVSINEPLKVNSTPL